MKETLVMPLLKHVLMANGRHMSVFFWLGGS